MTHPVPQIHSFARSGRDEVSRYLAEPDATIFRETDIRGKVLGGGASLTPSIANRIGRAFGTFSQAAGVDRVVVGHDSREYSESLSQSYITGLLSTGMQVLDIGLATTPMVYFAQHRLGGIGGTSVTASHNPNGWGGLKLSVEPSLTLGGAQMREVQSLVRNNNYTRGSGTYQAAEIAEDYISDLAARLAASSSLLAVTDGGNSVSGPIAEFALKRAGYSVRTLNGDLDWAFPNHEPDPELLSARRQIAEAVLTESAAIGLSFDGDGDRLGVTDEKGRSIWSDQLLAILARDVLSEHPGSQILFDVKCSRAVSETILQSGGRPVMWRTGHSHIKSKMREIGAPFAGERSGHFFNSAEYYGFDDACFTALWLLRVMTDAGKSLSQLVDELPQYVTTPTIQVPCDSDESKYKSVSLFREFARTFGATEIIEIDGVRAEFDDGWLLVRASSNMPSLVLVAESDSPEGLRRKYDLLRRGLSHDNTVSQDWENDPWA